MPSRFDFITDLYDLLRQYSSHPSILLDDKFFGTKLRFSSGEILDVLIHISKTYNLNLRDYSKSISIFTINGLADAFEKCCSQNGANHEES